MPTFYRWPCPDRGEFNRQFGGIVEALRNYSRYLPLLDWEEVHDENDADLVTGHLGTKSNRLDVFHLHGLYPTGEPQFGDGNFQGNAGVIENLRRAEHIIAVSDWVADIVRRDMHIDPYVLGHGFDLDKWDDVPTGTFSTKPFALWNKTRAGGVCDPGAVLELARRIPDYQFVTTFLPSRTGPPANVTVTGLLKHENAWRVVRDCSIYLATTKETFGIGTLEAMASGAAVIGFRWGATPEVVGDTGLLVDPGDYDMLAEAFRFAVAHRERLGEAARERVRRRFSWPATVQRLGEIYTEILEDKQTERPRVTVVIPCHNYARYVSRAIRCVKAQSLEDIELIVVDDGSTDGSAGVIRGEISNMPHARLIEQENAGVANARNRGIAAGRGRYVCCLDADDGIHPKFLEVLTSYMDQHPEVGIGYTGLQAIGSEDEILEIGSNWPGEYDPALWIGRNQIPTCCIFRKKAWERLGGYRQRFAPHGAGQEDADFWLRILVNGGGAVKVTDRNLFFYRIHPDQTTRRHKIFWHERHYLGWHPYATDNQYPLASQIGVPEKGTWPVRNYDQPEVSVIIPVGPRHVHTLVDALDSVEAQTLRHWECVVVNDSGQDLDLTAWPYVRLVETTGGRGAGYARNKGTERASAPLFVYLDADDVLHPTYLANTLETYRETGNWVYTDLQILHEDGKIEPYEVWDWNVEKLWRSGLAAVTCLYSKAMWEKAGGQDEELAGREDWDFHLRLAMAGYCGVRDPFIGFTYRHATGSRRAEGQFRKEIEILHDRYKLEDLMRRCGGCSKTKRRAPVNATIKSEDTGFVAMEYAGAPMADRTFRGRSRRTYRIGSGKNSKFWAHPSDVEQFLRIPGFRRVDLSGQATAPVLSVEAKPSPVSVVAKRAAPKPPQVTIPLPPARPQVAEKVVSPPAASVKEAVDDGIPDPANFTVSALKLLFTEQLEPEQWSVMLEMERAGKARKTAIQFLEEKAHGESNDAEFVVAGSSGVPAGA